MTSTSITAQDVVNKFNLANDPNAINALNISGRTPGSIVSHTASKKYILLGITPEDFIKQHGTMQFDMEKLATAFREICFDYLRPLVLEEPSMAVEFCSKILYEIGPGSRQVKKQDGDKVWKLIFPYNIEGKIVTKVAYICTFKNGQQIETGIVSKGCIILTIKQASLLAILVLDLINDISCTGANPIILLTPLAGAVFAKEDLIKISKELGAGLSTVATVVNSSAQSGGQYLPNSRCHVAAICSIVATRNVKNQDTRFQIINKTIRQYLSCKKEFEDKLFDAYSRYAHGGVPESLSAQKLIQQFDHIQEMSVSELVKASKESKSKTVSIIAGSSGSDGEKAKSFEVHKTRVTKK